MSTFTAAGPGAPPVLEADVADGVWIDTTSGDVWHAEAGTAWVSVGNLSSPETFTQEMKYRTGVEQDPSIVEPDPTV